MTLDDARDQLLAAWGIESRRVRALVCDLASGGWRTRRGLVEAHAISRRGVEDALRVLEPWLDHDGDRVRVRPLEASAVTRALGCDDPGDDVADDAAAVAFMVEALGGLPRPQRDLDHVSATPRTAIARAAVMLRELDLTGARVLCLGDHDLTSLALQRLRPGTRVTVVDVDEAVLAHVDQVARANAWQVRTVFADLRAALPRSVAGQADLVFTDPPYTPAGVRLFLARAIASLAPHEQARILWCYGFGERQPALALKVQAELGTLRLVAEAVLPRFNRYHGAEAIGSASALYVCRPTRRSWAAAERATRRVDARIYTHGAEALEAGGAGAEVSGPGFRALLRSRAARQSVTLDAQEAALLDDPGVSAVLASAYRLARDGTGDRVTVEAVRAEPPEDGRGALLRAIVDRPQATLGSAWREALIAAGAARTKNEARSRIAATDLAVHGPSYLDELPLGVLARLPAAVASTLEA